MNREQRRHADPPMTERTRRIASAIPNSPNADGTWTLGTINPDTLEFEPVCVATGKVSLSTARQFVAAGKARWGSEATFAPPHIVLKSGKCLLVGP